jgi:hypothetical protein
MLPTSNAASQRLSEPSSLRGSRTKYTTQATASAAQRPAEDGAGGAARRPGLFAPGASRAP